MGLFNKIFGNGGSNSPESRFADATDTERARLDGSGSGQHRELVHVVLRDTMRAHGVPSGWMEATVLKVSHGARAGLHVQLIVRREHPQLLAHVPAFQESFMSALRGFDARASEWMKSLSWVFEGTAGAASLPRPELKPTSTEPAAQDSDLQQDLKALFAIRDQALHDAANQDDPGGDFQSTRPMR